MKLSDVGRLLMIAGIGVIAVGMVLVLASRLGWGRLPGDLSFGDDNLRVYVPLGTCLLVSVIATLVLNLFLRR